MELTDIRVSESYWVGSKSGNNVLNDKETGSGVNA